jgi:hypothetical protein
MALNSGKRLVGPAGLFDWIRTSRHVKWHTRSDDKKRAAEGGGMRLGGSSILAAATLIGGSLVISVGFASGTAGPHAAAAEVHAAAHVTTGCKQVVFVGA